MDVAMIQHVEDETEFALVMGPGGMWELADRFVREGKARAIGLSTHNPDIVVAAAESGSVTFEGAGNTPAAPRVPQVPSARSRHPRLQCPGAGIPPERRDRSKAWSDFALAVEKTGGRTLSMYLLPPACVGYVTGRELLDGV